MTRFIVWTFSVSMVVVTVGAAWSQDPSAGLRTGYPNKPLRIVTSAVGGGNDIIARIVAPEISTALGQPVIVDNRTALIAIETVGKALADGYSLLFSGNTLWIGPLLQKAAFDAVRDFSPLSIVDRSSMVLVVHSSVPANTVKELIALAKARPGALNYSAGSVGGGPHLTAELFKAMAGVNIVRIPYKGTGPAINALVGGEVQMTFANPGAVEAHLKSGRIRALAVTGLQPSALAPGFPTVAASGLPGFESVSVEGLLLPAKTPAAIINRLNQVIVRALNQASIRETLLRTAGVEAAGSSPEELAAAIQSDIAVWGKLIKDLGIKAE